MGSWGWFVLNFVGKKRGLGLSRVCFCWSLLFVWLFMGVRLIFWMWCFIVLFVVDVVVGGVGRLIK